MGTRILLGVLGLVFASPVLAAGRPATVYTADGQKLVGTVLDESFAVKTSCGVVTVPVEQMRSMWPGFAADEATGKKIEQLIDDLGTPKRAKAEADLAAIGRPAVPHLEDAASASDAKVVAGVAEVLKTLWPSGAKVPSDDRDILLARGADLRGTFAFTEVHIEGPLGKATVPVAGLRVIQFEAGEPAVPPDPTAYGPVAGKDPEVEVSAVDGSQISGMLETAALDVDTPYGKVTVPLKELVSYKPGHPGEIVTRDLTFPGELMSAAFPLRNKLGVCKVPREDITLLKVRREAGATDLFPSRWVPWQEIFNGKDMKGWSAYEDGDPGRTVKDGTIHCTGNRWQDFIHEGAGPLANVILRVDATWNLGQGGIKLCVRYSKRDPSHYGVRFCGRKAALYLGRPAPDALPVPKLFDIPRITEGSRHLFELGVVGRTVRVGMDGKLIGEALPTNVFPAGKVGFSCDGEGYDVSIHSVQIKVLR